MTGTSQRQSHKQKSFADELLSTVVSLLQGKCVYNDCCYAILFIHTEISIHRAL